MVEKLVKVLETLHDEVAKKLLTEIRKPEVDPRMIAEAIKFLKNNDITAVPAPGSATGDLTDKLPFDENDKPLATIGA